MDFLKKFLDTTGIKYNVGYGYNFSLKKAKRSPYLKIRLAGERNSKFDFGVIAQLEGFVGPCIGIGLGKKKWAKFDIGVGTELSKEIDLGNIKPKGFIGLSISLN